MSISCEIPSETLSVCVHGVPVVFECGRCDDKHRITLLESQVKTLNVKVDNLLSAFLTNKSYQIDENRKISRRVDELEDFNKRHIDCNQHINERMEKLSATLCSLSGLYGNIKTLENIYKFPHKCPVCDGSIKILIDPSTPMSGIQSMFGKRDENGMYYKDCKSCEGKGIVWG